MNNKKFNIFSILSVILPGIVALLYLFMVIITRTQEKTSTFNLVILSTIGFIISITSLVFAIIGLIRIKKYQSKTFTLIFSIIGIVLSVLAIIGSGIFVWLMLIINALANANKNNSIQIVFSLINKF